MPKISLFFAILLVACGGAQSSAKPTHAGHEHEGHHTHGAHDHGDHEHGDHEHGDHEHGDHEHADHDHAAHHHGEHAHGEDGSAVSALHGKLAPLWHAPAGEQRTNDTCAAASEMHALGEKVVEESAKGSAADLERAKELEQTAAALKAECETPERKDFTAKLTAMHDAFHAVADAH